VCCSLRCTNSSLFRRNVGTGELATMPELYFISSRNLIAALTQHKHSNHLLYYSGDVHKVTEEVQFKSNLKTTDYRQHTDQLNEKVTTKTGIRKIRYKYSSCPVFKTQKCTLSSSTLVKTSTLNTSICKLTKFQTQIISCNVFISAINEGKRAITFQPASKNYYKN